MSKAKRYFLPYELDAFDNAGTIGVSCGLSPAQVVYGNMLMWRHVWRTKSDIVTTAHIQAFFGANACEALVLFGHLEASPPGWRVRGAKEWLRVMSAQSEAGKANAGNLKRGQNLPGSLPAYPPKKAEAGTKPAGSPPALPETSDQRPATSDQVSSVAEAPAKPRPPVLETLPPQKHPKPPKQPPNPRHTPLVQALTDAYREETLGAAYDFTGFDAVNVTRLLAKSADNEEIVFRWRTAIRLSLDKFHKPKVHTLGELCTHWNAYPTPPKDTHRTTEMRL